VYVKLKIKMSRNTFLLSGWEELHLFLQTGEHLHERCFFGFDANLVLQHEIRDQYHSIRVWSTNAWFCFWADELSVSNFIGAMDFTILTDHIRIDYLCVNDSETVKMFEMYKPRKPLSRVNAKHLVESFVCFVENFARKNSLHAIRKDVHQNLVFYKEYLRSNGFELTGIRCPDNPYWVRSELVLRPLKIREDTQLEALELED